ncbi:MAG: sporulation protein YqfD [Clostridia bacterium]|nr:sporulation protein YqfD [Clostridia bacterium]
MHLIHWIIGYYTVTLPTQAYNQARKILLSNSIHFFDFRLSPNGSTFCISTRQYRQTQRLLSSIRPTYSSIRGLPALFLSHRSRWGIPVGVFIAAFLFFSTQNIVWKINISGNDSISCESILTELSNAGFHVGSKIDPDDLDQLHNQILATSSDIAWISINLSGVVANVEVREHQKATPSTPPESALSNIVASADGLIHQINVKSGKRVVEIGQVVKKGELLISGISDSQTLGARYEQAEGEVYAYINKEIIVTTPTQSLEKVYTGKEFRKIRLNFFGKSINIFSNCGNLPATCDRIEEEIPILLFGRFSVPITVSKETYREYAEQPTTLSVQEAVDLTMARLTREITNKLKSAELISKTVSLHYSNGAVTATCTLYCIEDIATPLTFQISQ